MIYVLFLSQFIKLKKKIQATVIASSTISASHSITVINTNVPYSLPFLYQRFNRINLHMLHLFPLYSSSCAPCLSEDDWTDFLIYGGIEV